MQIRGVLILILVVVGTSAAADPSAAASRFRNPVALAVTGDHVLVANHGSGTVSVLDTQRLGVTVEFSVGRTISDVAASRDGRFVYVTDETAGDLVCITWDEAAPVVVRRLPVASYPMSVRVAPDGTFCVVASLWSRRLTIVDLMPGDMRVRTVIDLPFAPREQCLMPDARSLIVADSFGGNLARVDLSTSAVTQHRTLQAHNIRGLAVSADGRDLLVAHQMIDANTPTEPSRISWGQVVGNVLRAVPVSEILSAKRKTGPVEHWSLYPLGQNGRGAGDPGAIVVAPSGLTAVALSGVNEVALRDTALSPFRRIKVGRRPTALAFSSDAKRLFVANTFDDSVSVIDVSASRVVATVSLGPHPPLTEEALGERLFYDARLSLDGWYSCHSCHTDGHANGGRNDNFSDGSAGTPKQIPSLRGVEESRPWGWSGQMPTHEVQVQRSILNTMHGPPAGATADNVNALAAFIRSLPPVPGVATARGEGGAEEVVRGRRVFAELRCGRCHGKPDYTSERSYDVGLTDAAGQSRFNPPSLLGVSQRDAYLHDSRARTLPEVFVKFGHPDGRGVEGKSVDDLVAFLRSL